MNNMTMNILPGVPVEIGGQTFSLRYPLGAFMRAEALGVDPMTFASTEIKGISQVITWLWVGLLPDAPDIKQEDLANAIGFGDLPRIQEAIEKAIGLQQRNGQAEKQGTEAGPKGKEGNAKGRRRP